MASSCFLWDWYFNAQPHLSLISLLMLPSLPPVYVCRGSGAAVQWCHVFVTVLISSALHFIFIIFIRDKQWVRDVVLVECLDVCHHQHFFMMQGTMYCTGLWMLCGAEVNICGVQNLMRMFARDFVYTLLRDVLLFFAMFQNFMLFYWHCSKLQGFVRIVCSVQNLLGMFARFKTLWFC